MAAQAHFISMRKEEMAAIAATSTSLEATTVGVYSSKNASAPLNDRSELELNDNRQEQQQHKKKKMELPMFKHLPAVVEHITSTALTSVTADTGSGKTSLIPNALAEAGMRVLLALPQADMARAMFQHTQSQNPGLSVGYMISAKHVNVQDSQMVVATGGSVWNLLLRDRALAFDVLILDEAHTVSGDYEMLESVLKWMCTYVFDGVLPFHVVICSATTDQGAMARRWRTLGVMKHFHVAVPMFPVVETWHKHAFVIGRDDKALLKETVVKIEELNKRAPPGHFLVFAPGVGMIDQIVELIWQSQHLSNMYVYVAHGNLSEPEMAEALDQKQPNGPSDFRRSIIVTTPVLASSVTVPWVVAVVNLNLQKQMQATGHTSFGQKLVTVPCSAFDRIQRKGRAGRMLPGFAHHMCPKPRGEEGGGGDDDEYTREFERRPMFPEVMSALAHDIAPLQLFPEYSGRVSECVQELQRLGLLVDGTLSKEARFLSRLPLSFHFALLLNRFRDESETGMQHNPWHVRILVMVLCATQVSEGSSLLYLPRKKPPSEESRDQYQARLRTWKEQKYSRFRGKNDLSTTAHIILSMMEEVEWNNSSSSGSGKQQLNRRHVAWANDNGMNNKMLRSVRSLMQRVFRLAGCDPDWADYPWGKSPDDVRATVEAAVEAWLPTLQAILADQVFVRDAMQPDRWWNETERTIYFRLASSCTIATDGGTSIERLLSVSPLQTDNGQRTLGFLYNCVPLPPRRRRLAGHQNEGSSTSSESDDDNDGW